MYQRQDRKPTVACDFSYHPKFLFLMPFLVCKQATISIYYPKIRDLSLLEWLEKRVTLQEGAR